MKILRREYSNTQSVNAIAGMVFVNVKDVSVKAASIVRVTLILCQSFDTTINPADHLSRFLLENMD